MNFRKIAALSLSILMVLGVMALGSSDWISTSNLAPTVLAESGNTSQSNRVTIDAANRSPWLNLKQGPDVESLYRGTSRSELENRQLTPLTMASADLNADGYADLVSGFSDKDGSGMLTIRYASREAFEPTSERTLEGIRRAEFPQTFDRDVRIVELPTSPDFIVSGKFSQDSNGDLVIASRGHNSIYLLTSDGDGGFADPLEIMLDGGVTSLASASLDASKIYAAVVVATSAEGSSTMSIFDGKKELIRAFPRKFEIQGKVDSLILAASGGIGLGIDIFGIADGEIFTMSQAGDQRSSIDKIELPFRAADFAVGEFIRDREVRAEIAVLSEDGNVSYLTRGTLDTRAFTTADAQEYFRANGGRGRGNLPTKTTTDNLSNDWTVAETHQLGVYRSSGDFTRTLKKAYITGNETEDLLVTDENSRSVKILFKEPNYDSDRTAFTGETKSQTVHFSASPASLLPMRLNVMGQQGFVTISKGSLEPTVVMAAPNATFAVTKTADTNDGTCNADCSVREAINAANAAAGSDLVTFTPNGTFQLTIDLASTENAGTEGDLDVTQALSIVGNGTGNTILQAGTNATNGIDKVLSFNPNFNAAFASSITGVTVRFGRNPSGFAVDGFGGGLDWDSFQTGTLTLSNVVVDQNSTIDGDGGGVVATSTPAAGNSFVSITNSTISNNQPDRSPAGASPLGGGIFVGTVTTFRLTTTILSGNDVVESFMSGQGGGIYAFGPASAAGKSFMTTSTVSGNIAPNDGGGIYSTQPIDFNTSAIISNNSSGRNGGGIWVNHTNGTTAISKATMIGNSATTTGGAMYLNGSTTANVLNVSFSRIVGNTGGGFRGLAVDGGTANVESNWWGCNTGPSAAPCDTAGVIGVGTGDFDPWLQLRLTASPNTTPVVGESRALTASFLLNSAGGAVAASNLDVLIGVPVTWSASGGTISGSQATIQPSGTATATFTATAASPPSRTATAQVDNGPANVNFTVGQASTTTAITSDNPDPSVVGQTITVTYTVSVTAPGAGTPTGNVTVSDGVNSCMGTVAAGSCNVALTTAGARTLTATYPGDANFATSSDTEPHQVNQADTMTTIIAESADPTARNEPFTVFYSVATVAPGAGTPTGNVTVTDGVNSCVGTVAAGNCTLQLNTAGMRTLTATYAGNANFSGSVSPGEPHTVLPTTAAPASITGRVLTSNGSGIRNVTVSLTDSSGEVRLTRTSSFGYYTFTDLPTGQTYVITVSNRRYVFDPNSRVIVLNDELSDVNFVGTMP